jgi:hypothetical protein
LHVDGKTVIVVSIHAPRVGSDILPIWLIWKIWVSIHAPRVGSDWAAGCWPMRGLPFQSTLPVWGATQWTQARVIRPPVSIHAPRVGSDGRLGAGKSLLAAVSIHAPRVGSDWAAGCWPTRGSPFQSTLPVWGATLGRRLLAYAWVAVSIHAPRVGSDRTIWYIAKYASVSIHAPRVGSDPPGGW